MTSNKDGGRAFPRTDSVWTNPNTGQQNGTPGHPGMSLLEYYAGAALIGMGTWCPDGCNADLNDSLVIKNRAKWAIEQAEAAIAELDERDGTSKTDLEEELIEMLGVSAQRLDHAASLLRSKDSPGLARVLAEQANNCLALLAKAKAGGDQP